MKRFEYKIAYLHNADYYPYKTYERQLNDLGEDGWELIQIKFGHNQKSVDTDLAYFKREIVKQIFHDEDEN